MRLSNDDKALLNYINSMPNEYGDELLLKDTREEFFWRLSKIRRYSFSFYELPDEAELLLAGDYFGTLTGIACEKSRKVISVLPMKVYADAIKHRYSERENLCICVEPYENWELDKKFKFVLVNLECLYDYDWHNTYEFDKLINPVIRHLQSDGKLLLFARGDQAYHIKRLLYRLNFFYVQDCDPLGNGGLFIEASRLDNLSELKPIYPSPLIDDKWTRTHWFMGRGGEIYDQDLKLIEEVKLVQVELLQKLVSVCEENGLAVYPMYGTLLGIIRDGGMIPGDDDIDVAMPRADYDKLLRLKDKFDDKFFLQSPYTDDCFYGGYTKLRNVNTTAIHPQNEWTEACEGISIDIFPLDSTFVDKEKEKNKNRKIRILQRILFAKSYGFFKEFRDMPMFKWKSYKYFGKLFDREKLIDKLYQIMTQGDSSSSRYAIYCHYRSWTKESARYLEKSAFKNTISLLYEGVEMQVPENWDLLLKNLYGESYWNRHGFDEGKRRHGFYDVNIPYTVYKKRFGGLKHPKNIVEPIVLFGEGSVFKACLSYYKERVNIPYLVQLPGESPMESIMGIPVKRWEEFLTMEIEKSSYRAVICSGNARVAEKILKDAGFEDYYIFWYNREWMLYANQTQIWKEIQNL